MPSCWSWLSFVLRPPWTASGHGTDRSSTLDGRPGREKGSRSFVGSGTILVCRRAYDALAINTPLHAPISPLAAPAAFSTLFTHA